MIRTAWFKYAPHRAWQMWFWIRVDKERRRLKVRANSSRIALIVSNLDEQLYLPKRNVSFNKKT